jgi:hypothetical protein
MPHVPHEIKRLISRETIENAIDAPPVIGDNEPWGHLMTVVVQDHTVVTHMRVIGSGGRLAMNQRRRVETAAVLMFPGHWELHQAARQILEYASTLPRATIAVDMTGAGLYLLKTLKSMMPSLPAPVHICEVSQGARPRNPDNAQRFLNVRAQACIDAAEAFGDGKVRIDAMEVATIEQGTAQTFVEKHGVYEMTAKREMAAAGIAPTSVFDSLALGFAEGVSYVPAVVKEMTDAWVFDLDRIEHAANRGMGASSGDTLRLLAEVREYRRLQKEFAQIARNTPQTHYVGIAPCSI